MAHKKLLLACFFAILLSTGCTSKPKTLVLGGYDELRGQGREPEISLTID
ncbi:MAG: hypothetical protein ACKO8U_21080 [Pirellula sp.]